MKVYLAWIQIADWETTPENIGIYSSKEKAKQAVLNQINDSLWNSEKDMFLSLEIYNETYAKNHNEPFWYRVEEFELDE